MNYTPKSVTAARASLKIDIQTTQANGVYPSTVTIRKGPVATGGNYVWNILRDTTVEVSPTTGIGTSQTFVCMKGHLLPSHTL